VPVAGSRQRVEQRLCLFEIGCVEAFGEPAVNRREQVAGFGVAALVAAEPGEARHGSSGLAISGRVLDKPQRREISVAIEFVGFSIGDVFVVGYGTDYAEKYRHLPYIGIVE
jgi:hypothetical protein